MHACLLFRFNRAIFIISDNVKIKDVYFHERLNIGCCCLLEKFVLFIYDVMENYLRENIKNIRL